MEKRTKLALLNTLFPGLIGVASERDYPWHGVTLMISTLGLIRVLVMGLDVTFALIDVASILTWLYTSYDLYKKEVTIYEEILYGGRTILVPVSDSGRK